jgi:hypothetical protein
VSNRPLARQFRGKPAEARLQPAIRSSATAFRSARENSVLRWPQCAMQRPQFEIRIPQRDLQGLRNTLRWPQSRIEDGIPLWEGRRVEFGRLPLTFPHEASVWPRRLRSVPQTPRSVPRVPRSAPRRLRSVPQACGPHRRGYGLRREGYGPDRESCGLRRRGYGPDRKSCGLRREGLLAGWIPQRALTPTSPSRPMLP